jgi:hypothetical protein
VLSFDVLVGFAAACGARPEYILSKVHQLQLPLLNAILAPDEVPSDPLSNITDEEKQELIRYLAFLRLKRSVANQPWDKTINKGPV